MSDTPETDAIRLTIAAGDWVKESDATEAALAHADKLERERSEAREQTKACVLAIEALTDGYGNLTAERDQLRKVADELADYVANVKTAYEFEQNIALPSTNSTEIFEAEKALLGYNSLPHVIERTNSK